MPEKLRIYTDGGARGNPGPAGIGVVICDYEGNVLQEHNETIGDTTNNVAEYTAVIVALELAKNLGGKIIDHYVDSQLVANQLMGKFKIKAPHIKALFLQAKSLIQNFDEVKFTQVPRETEGIRQADKLVNAALDGVSL